MLRNLSEKLRTKFPSTTFGYSVVRISCLGDALAGILELESGSKPSIRSTNAAKRYQKENKERWNKENKNLKSLKIQVKFLSKTYTYSRFPRSIKFEDTKDLYLKILISAHVQA